MLSDPLSSLTRRQFTSEAALATAVVLGAGTQCAAASAGRGTVARVAPYKGVPWLFINDRPHSPQMYFFPVPVKEHIADFAAAGIDIYSWGFQPPKRGIPHTLDMGWNGPDRYDYSEFDAQVSTILDACPRAYLIPRLGVSAPQWWLESHPEDRTMYEDGTWGRSVFETSMASKVWLRDATAAMGMFIRHVREMPYRDHFIGYHVVGGLNEWFYAGHGYPDFSKASIRSFQAWLKSRYAGDVSILRAAWKQPGVEFESASIPTKEERLATDVNLLRDPAKSRHVSDYYEFFSDVQADAIIEFCRVGKQITNQESLFGPFYGYQINATGGNGGSSRWGHQALRKVLAAPEVDFVCAPYQYVRRGPGGYDGPQVPDASVKLHGKLFLTECDGRLFTTELGVASAIQGVRPTPAESFGVLKRDLAQRLTRRQGLWWMDLIAKGGWYHHPDIARFLARARSLYDKSAALDMHYQGEVAVIVDERTPFYLKPGNELLYPLMFLQDRAGFSRMGAPYDIYFHNDLSIRDMPDYKLYIFLNTLYLTEAERQAIRNRICGGNKVAVWMYGPGVISENGLSRENMRDLTGINLAYRVFAPEEPRLSCRAYITDYDHPITRDCESGTYFGSDAAIAPVFYSEDSEARTLGRLLASRGVSLPELPAFVIKDFTNWKSIFIGAPNVPAQILRSIAAFAGCHVYSDSSDIIYANSHFVSIHTDKRGPKRIRLPKRCDVYDAFTEALVAKDVSEFTDTLGPRATRLYFLGDVSQIRDQSTRFEL